jgi:hypothetical protein
MNLLAWNLKVDIDVLVCREFSYIKIACVNLVGKNSLLSYQDNFCIKIISVNLIVIGLLRIDFLIFQVLLCFPQLFLSKHCIW